ncbi:mandelate racemase/muconate lactonizing enzyme family protein, partial [Aquiflexum sp.]|uniref:mandelate racemase/muconate lactonizing enzyme family protein n=1 Tax=Aquiflexum sp. TaxID=1872584 RepID=UPI0035931962
MKNRRSFLKKSLSSSALLLMGGQRAFSNSSHAKLSPADLDSELEAILNKPVLRRGYFPNPVILESVDLLINGSHYIVRVRSTDGAEGYAISNEGRMPNLWPFFIQQVAPYFKGKDARDLDFLVDDCLNYNSNYKYMSMAALLPIASAEFAILELLGQISGKSAGELMGEVIRPEIDVYTANNYRGKSAEESVERIVAIHKEENSKAVKFKLGGRMGLPEEPPGRSEKLIPMLRKALGDEVVIYADANGSYEVEEAIKIGRLLEEINVAFFEEPCPFDWIWETKAIGDALAVPIAGGEQESSMRRFRWMVANDGLQVFQPDLFYFGGFIRSIKVARMAEFVNKPCTPHMSGWGLGSLYMLHYASIVPNAGAHQEYKGVSHDIPFESSAGSLEAREGKVAVPKGPGFGVSLDPNWIAKSKELNNG